MSWWRRSGHFKATGGAAWGICLAFAGACLFAGAAAGAELLSPITDLEEVLPPDCSLTKSCPAGTVLGIVSDVPPDLQKLLQDLNIKDPEVLGLVLQQAAGLAQVVSNVGSVASGLSQDVVSGVLDVALEPEAAAVLGPVDTASLGSSSSAFMISGYKHLSHDGFSVSSQLAPATGKGPAFDQDEYGLTLGTRFDGSEAFGAQKGTVTFGVIGNYTHTDIDVGAAPNAPPNFHSGSASIESWSAGGYGMVTDGRRYGLVTISGTFGSPETDNALLASSADYSTFGFAASAISGVLVPMGSAKLDLRGGLNYLHASSDDYTDSIGTTYTDARLEEFSGSLSARLFTVMRVGDFQRAPLYPGRRHAALFLRQSDHHRRCQVQLRRFGYQCLRAGRHRFRCRQFHSGLSRRARRCERRFERDRRSGRRDIQARLGRAEASLIAPQ